MNGSWGTVAEVKRQLTEEYGEDDAEEVLELIESISDMYDPEKHPAIEEEE